MRTKGLELHQLLLRQLKKADMSIDDIHQDKRTNWNELINRISRTYSDHDQDKYILERSMEISSKELMALNEKLESAQQIAHLGYWLYDLKTDKLIWSKEMYNLSGCDPSDAVPGMEDIFASIHKDDRETFKDMLNQVAIDGRDCEIELRFKNWKNKKYYWHFVKFRSEQKAHDTSDNIRFISGVVIDITDRKEYELRAAQTQQKLVFMSRQAGMAEVATSILHNIGNILNSANVSLSILQENFTQPYYEKLFKIAMMMRDNINSLEAFLLKDPKGQLVPRYLVELIELLAKIHQTNQVEVNHITNHLAHIKDIVSMQKAISGTSGVFEKIVIAETIDKALQITNTSSKTDIQFEKQYDDIPQVLTDKTKLLQILVNLIQNAKDAVEKLPLQKQKKIRILLKHNFKNIKIIVRDNGIGIPEEQLNRVFAFGFTTKDKGHGFGLHSSALAAQEMGGTLEAESRGHQCGATFILTLPVNDRTK